jgi:hypothetical protein
LHRQSRTRKTKFVGQTQIIATNDGEN